MMESFAWNIIYKQWHCWSEILPAVWQIYLTELSGAWKQSGNKSLGRGGWGMAEQGWPGALAGDMRGDIILSGRLVRLEDHARGKGERVVRVGTKAICSQQVLAPQMSCRRAKGQSKEISSLDYSPPPSALTCTHTSLFFSSISHQGRGVLWALDKPIR